MTYDEFEDTAAALFGLDPYEAAVLAEQMVADGYDLDRTAAESERFWSAASEYEAVDVALADVELPEEEPGIEVERYRLDSRFPDDDWLDPGDVWEISAEAYTD